MLKCRVDLCRSNDKAGHGGHCGQRWVPWHGVIYDGACMPACRSLVGVLHLPSL